MLALLNLCFIRVDRLKKRFDRRCASHWLSIAAHSQSERSSGIDLHVIGKGERRHVRTVGVAASTVLIFGMGCT